MRKIRLGLPNIQYYILTKFENSRDEYTKLTRNNR